jgi:hypothetical protein
VRTCDRMQKAQSKKTHPGEKMGAGAPLAPAAWPEAGGSLLSESPEK